MKVYFVAKDTATEEMKSFFEERTNKHIDRVKKYCKKIEEYDAERFSGLVDRSKTHDQGKFEEPEYGPYLYITWQYRAKEKGETFDLPDGMKDKMTKATEHHVKNNRHHPEFHSSKDVDLINREDRDKPPKEMIDATSMKDIDIGEMVADWFSMSEEKKTSPKDWADKNVNVRWKFTKEQSNLIYELIESVWNS